MDNQKYVSWYKTIPFILMHILPLGILFTGMRWIDVFVCIGLYYGRMFFITAGFHRYFAHRTYTMGRWMQFLMAFGGTMAAQKGVLWWASYHRHHHHYSDQPQDIHSPHQGFWWSHIGWIMSSKYDKTQYNLIKDFAAYPELVFLNKYYLLPPTILALVTYFVGGSSMLLGGFFLSTVLLYHGTFVINSLTHLMGKRQYVTRDSSRNSFVLALITCGEGWHNNHHYYPASVRQGFFWWELDMSYYVLKFLRLFHLAKNFQLPPLTVLKNRLIQKKYFDIGLLSTYWQRGLKRFPNLSLKEAQLFLEAKQQALDEFVREGKISAKRLKSIIYGVLSTAVYH